MNYSFKKLALAAALLAAPSFAGPGLADGFAKFVGNITTRGQVRSDFGTYWNQITAENECKWASIEGSRGNYNFSGCKAAYDWAKNNGGHFKFHALVWGSQYPNWLGNLSENDTKTAITNWFDAVKKQFPDIELIDVVNEAIRTGNNQYHSGYPNTKIIQALGGDNGGNYQFVTTAFKMARERWPQAILIYNDYNTVQWNKDQGIDLINTIKKNGAPVDAYGLQAHDMTTQGGGAGGTGGGGGCLSINTVKSVIEEIWNKTQTPMFISEYDISIADDNSQKQCFEQQISYFMENEHIAGITIWGYIYGSTWIDHSGIIKDGRDRAAMTWLKQYFGNESNKAKSKNSTGLAGGGEYVPPEPVPREPFKGSPAVVPGKIEVEDYDKNGVGKDSVTGISNITFEDDYTNDGKSTYRGDDGVDIYDEGTGHVLGMTKAGEWVEYTIDVQKDGEYTIVTNAAAGGTTAAIRYLIDGKAITDEIKIDQTADNKWDVYKDFSAKTSTITAGKHILRLEITGDYANVDYFTFTDGSAQTTDPVVTPTDPMLVKDIELETETLQDYYVYDPQGVHLGVMSAYGFNAAAQILQMTNDIKRSGVYMLRSRKTGHMMSVRVVR